MILSLNDDNDNDYQVSNAAFYILQRMSTSYLKDLVFSKIDCEMHLRKVHQGGEKMSFVLLCIPAYWRKFLQGFQQIMVLRLQSKTGEEASYICWHFNIFLVKLIPERGGRLRSKTWDHFFNIFFRHSLLVLHHSPRNLDQQKEGRGSLDNREYVRTCECNSIFFGLFILNHENYIWLIFKNLV